MAAGAAVAEAEKGRETVITVVCACISNGI